MASVFNITTASNTVHLDARGQGEIAFTVSNTSRRHLRGRAKLVPQDPAQKGWLTVVGEPERDLPSGGVQQFTVQVSVPAASKEGKYVFRLDAVSVQNPDEDYTQGPAVAFTVSKQEEHKPFPWLIIAVAAVVLVIGGVTAYFLPGRKVRVPNVVGSDIAAANGTLQKAGFRGEEASRVTSEGKAQDTVLSQSPGSGDRVKSGSTVQLTVADAGTAVPNVLGFALDGAVNALQGAKLQVKAVTRSASDKPPGTILDQDPQPGGLVKLGTTVSIGVNELVKVPQVVGMNVEEAKSALVSANLTVGQLRTHLTDEGVTGTVLSQNPAQGSMAEIGAAIQLETAQVRPKPIGCDGVPGSGKVVDNCGVCGGNNACLRPCPAQTVSLGNDYVSIFLDLPQTDVGETLSWSDAGVYTYHFPRCYRVAISGLRYSCNRTPNGGTWVETGNVTRDANCFNTGNSNQPYLRVQR
ncbi:MAG TPA: PASTA domain-containing protein [Terriglobia bacterium]